MQECEVVKARDRESAIDACRYHVGQSAVLKELHATANSDGTFSVFPKFAVRPQLGLMQSLEATRDAVAKAVANVDDPDLRRRLGLLVVQVANLLDDLATEAADLSSEGQP